MFNRFRIRNSVTIALLLVALSGCRTITPMNQAAFPSAEQLITTIDQQHGGDANKLLDGHWYRVSSGKHWMYYTAYASKGRVDLLNALKTRGWDPNGRVPGSTEPQLPLRGAIRTKSVAAVKSLIEVGADPDRLATDCEMGGPFGNAEIDECNSALSQVVWFGTPDMVAPILEASEEIVWYEHQNNYSRRVFSDVYKGTEAIRYGARRAYELGRGDMFAQAFTQAGYGEVVADAEATYREGIRTAKKKRIETATQSDGNTVEDGLATLGLGLMLGVGTGAVISGDIDPTMAGGLARSFLENGFGSESGGSTSGGSGAASSSGSSSVASSGGGGVAIDEQYRPTCPGGRKASRAIPIKTNSQACAKAMRTYARAASCNLYEEQGAAERAYYSACASEIYK